MLIDICERLRACNGSVWVPSHLAAAPEAENSGQSVRLGGSRIFISAGEHTHIHGKCKYTQKFAITVEQEAEIQDCSK